MIEMLIKKSQKKIYILVSPARREEIEKFQKIEKVQKSSNPEKGMKCDRFSFQFLG